MLRDNFTRRHVLIGTSAAIISGAAPRSAWGKTDADVVIIGVGLAGLNAARLLEAAGLKCLIVEGEKRVGGRLHTLDDLPGKPEAGGIQIGAGYKRLHAIVDDLKVALDVGAGGGAGAAESPSALFNISGETIVPADWAMSSVNRLSESEKAMSLLTLGFKYGASLPRLDNPEAWLTADPALDISYAEALRKAGASPEAMRLIETNLNGNTLAGMSQLHLARAVAIFRAGPGPVSTIRGGSQRLPEAMAANLKTPVRLGQLVTGMREDAGGVTVQTSKGNIRARHAICTIPFAALRHIPVEADTSQFMATMVASLPYTRASFAYLSASEPFWKSDGLPETLWTDSPWLGRVFVLGDDPPMLKVWVTGANSDFHDRQNPDVVARKIVAAIEAARPSAKGKLKFLRLFSWQKNPMARGIYHHIGTGQAATLASATYNLGRRLHFAGEHLAQASSGMEAALESGERAAKAIIAAP